MGVFRSYFPNIDIQWFSRPLHGFEFTSVAELAADYDLIVFDHPFVGDIAASSCLLPLDDVLDPSQLTAFVGPSLETYRFAERLWAIPIDAACQVAVFRPDLMAKINEPPPADWSGLIALGRKLSQANLSLAIGLRGVHSLMTFFALCANLGSPCNVEPHLDLVDHKTARHVLALLRELVSYCPGQCLDWNSIELHDAMISRDDLAFCPAVYCYATYAETDQPCPMRFCDLPGPKGPTGSTIGGAGLGISARCRHPDAARTYARFAASHTAQLAFARNHGQPALQVIWDDDAINRRFGDCYRSTRQTIEQSWIRPRYPGYLQFQAKAGILIEQHLRGAVAETTLLAGLERLHNPKAGSERA
jgi:multiple sugar transport system substrate-binding protein